MSALSITWKDASKYCSGEMCLLGKYHVGTVFYDGLTKEHKWKISIRLPGIKIKDEVRADTIEEGKSILEHAISVWVKNAGLCSVYDVTITDTAWKGSL